MFFEIRALNAAGRCSLTVEALDEQAAKALARNQGYQVLAVRPRSARRKWLPTRGKAFPLVLFTRELMALLASGLSLVEALETLAEKEGREENRAVLNKVIGHLYEGERFSSAIAHVPKAFPSLYVSVVQAAEKTSNLPEALTRYVAYQEQVEGVRKKVVAAAVYPVLLLVVGGLVALFLVGFVTPRFAGVYEGNLDRLPWASRLLLDLGAMIQSHGLMALLALAMPIGLALWGFRHPRVRAWVSRLLWRSPGLGERLRVFHLTRFYRTVGMLLSGGIPVVTALAMAEGLLHPELRVRLQGASRLIREGQPLSAAMEARGLSTPVASRLLRVGEKSGDMGEMMESVARFHDEELARFVDWFTRLVEPVLMILIGLVIGSIVVLLYLPIFEMVGGVG